MDTLQIAVIPGDGIGSEVMDEGIKVLDAAAKIDGSITFKYTSFPWSCQYYLEHGVMMPSDGIQTLSNFHHIFLGAVGWPTVADHVSLWGLLIPIRRSFEQYVNLRPTKLLRGVESPLRNFPPKDFVFSIVRENTEGEYSNMGGRLHSGQDYEIVVQNTVFTRIGTKRIIEAAFDMASQSRQYVVGATKSNGINYTMPFWDEVFNEVAAQYPSVKAELMHVDALAAQFVLKPEVFDIVVASNLLGDVLSDLGSALMGSIGIAPSANINPTGQKPCMFEPVHGSAPDIAGKGIANPIGQIWSAKMLLDHLGKAELGDMVLAAIEDVMEQGMTTPDLGGKATTKEVGDAIVAHFMKRAHP